MRSSEKTQVFLVYSVSVDLCTRSVEVVSLKTSLRIAKRNSHSLVGFPIKSLNEWQRTLVQAGFQLAICNQTDKKLVSIDPCIVISIKP